MKKTIKTTTIALAALVLGLTFTSCKKEKVKGCKTSYATNYNSIAEEDDGSCTYSGRYVIWVPTGTFGTGDSVNVYIDGVFQGNIAVEFASAPACGATGALTIVRDLGKDQTKGYSTTYKVVIAGVVDTDPNNWLVRTSTFKANTCVSYMLN